MASDQQNDARSRSLTQLQLSLLSIIVGMVAGLGAVVFRKLIAVFHNFFFLGRFSSVYHTNQHTPPSSWGGWIILVPVVGAVGVGFLVRNFAREASGSGVPQVIDAIYYKKGRIRPIVGVIKAIATALSIGTGGSVGREGPMIEIGASFGSAVSQLLRLATWQRLVLIAGASAGGIAAMFNSPVGGVLFALELLMPEVSMRTIVPVTIATEMSTYVARWFFGASPVFVIPSFETPSFENMRPVVLLTYAGLGIITGLVAALFIRSLYAFEDFFERHISGNYYRQHLLGMFVVGGLIYMTLRNFGHYYIEGLGYSTVQDFLVNTQFPLYLIVVLFVLKLFVTSLTLGSGASGGIFSPAMFLGVTAGTAYAIIFNYWFPSLDLNPAGLAVAGMAGVIGGSTGAVMAAIVMIFEMTLDSNILLPMTIVTALSYGVRKVLVQESIYTMKDALHGHHVPDALRTNPHLAKPAKEIMVTRLGVLSANGALEELMRAAAAQPQTHYFLVESQKRVIGVINPDKAVEALRQLPSATKLADIAAHDFITVGEQTVLAEINDNLYATKSSMALVTDGAESLSAENVKGIIGRQELADAAVAASDLYAG